MKLIVWASMPILTLSLALPAVAARAKVESDTAAAKAPVLVRNDIRQIAENNSKPDHKAAAETATAESPDTLCSGYQKEKKKSGLGGLLRAARNSGLLNAVAGHSGTGAVVGSVASTAIDVAAASASTREAASDLKKPHC